MPSQTINHWSAMRARAAARRCRAGRIGNNLACSNECTFGEKEMVIAPVIFVRPSTILILMHWSEIKGHDAEPANLPVKDEEM